MILNILHFIRKHIIYLSETECPSPDSSGNPFYFSFKNKKIATDSRNKLQKKMTSLRMSFLCIEFDITILLIVQHFLSMVRFAYRDQ
ncbi:hypothetical protein CLU82_0647 [Flavobacterium sp. 5]|nr:hypothetical protein CLU82_0647 [Flavobacterium sp. 5]